MTAEAPRGMRVWSLIGTAPVLALVLAAGCAWKVSPAEKSSGAPDQAGDVAVGHTSRLEVGCDGDGNPPPLIGPHGPYSGPLGPYACGETFATKLWSECHECRDRGCKIPEDGVAQCRCFGVAEYCVPNATNDGGVDTFCFQHGSECECDDDKGRIYECECEGEVSTPDECWCGTPFDQLPTFDDEHACDR